MKEELLKGLTEEQVAKIKACKNQEEVLALAKEEGIELTDEQLEAVNGGACTVKKKKCPKCGSEDLIEHRTGDSCHITELWYECKNCGTRIEG